MGIDADDERVYVAHLFRRAETDCVLRALNAPTMRFVYECATVVRRCQSFVDCLILRVRDFGCGYVATYKGPSEINEPSPISCKPATIESVLVFRV